MTTSDAYMVASQSGSVSAADTSKFTPFGEGIGNDPGANNRQGFTGHIEDETGLTYMQARYYDPVIGRFLSPDPIGYADGLNIYAYVGNDPINGSDPTGQYLEVRGGKEFREKVKEQLEELKQTPTGRELVETLDADTKHWFVIQETDGNSYIDPANRNRSEQESRSDAQDSSKGSGAYIHHNPNAIDPETPASVVLGHELGHAKEFADGELKDPPHHEDKARETENKIRNEMGLPERTSY